MRTPTKQLNNLTLLDRFLFASVMEDKRSLELALSIIMGEEVSLRQPGEVEKEFRTMPWLRSIRLDVYSADDKNRIYDAEVQKRNTGGLAKRSRFYQALIDSTLLPPGEGMNFHPLPESFLIMITPFDLWGRGRYRYTFKMRCEEEPDLYLNDGITRIFLNTRGTNDGEVSQELAELLHYIEDSSDEMARTCSSEKVQELHRRASEVKASEEYGVKYMQAWEEKLYERMDGKAEGLAEGMAAGLAEGMALAQYLLKAKRYDDLERAVRDPAYRDELCRELDLQKAAAANE